MLEPLLFSFSKKDSEDISINLFFKFFNNRIHHFFRLFFSFKNLVKLIYNYFS